MSWGSWRSSELQLSTVMYTVSNLVYTVLSLTYINLKHRVVLGPRVRLRPMWAGGTLKNLLLNKIWASTRFHFQTELRHSWPNDCKASITHLSEWRDHWLVWLSDILKNNIQVSFNYSADVVFQLFEPRCTSVSLIVHKQNITKSKQYTIFKGSYPSVCIQPK